MPLDKFQMIANCYGGSDVLHMLILHSKCSINVPTSCVWPGTCKNIWNVPNLLLVGKWQVLSTRACNVLKMFLSVSRPPCPQCTWHGFSSLRPELLLPLKQLMCHAELTSIQLGRYTPTRVSLLMYKNSNGWFSLTGFVHHSVIWAESVNRLNSCSWHW